MHLVFFFPFRELVATTIRESTDSTETSRWTGAHDYLFEYALIAQSLIRAGARVDLTLKVFLQFTFRVCFFVLLFFFLGGGGGGVLRC